MIAAAYDFAEPDSFDVSAELNPHFGEILSWQKLPDSKKETILEFLKLGYQEKYSKLQSDSIHFLGCMALAIALRIKKAIESIGGYPEYFHGDWPEGPPISHFIVDVEVPKDPDALVSNRIIQPPN